MPMIEKGEGLMKTITIKKDDKVKELRDLSIVTVKTLSNNQLSVKMKSEPDGNEMDIAHYKLKLSNVWENMRLMNIGCLPLNGKKPMFAGYSGHNYRTKKDPYDNFNHGKLRSQNGKSGLLNGVDNTPLNLGIHTGESNNLIVLDFDYFDVDIATNKLVEKPSINQIIKMRDDIITITLMDGGKPYINETPKGGHHLYFKYCPLMSKADGLIDGPPGIDVRANGGHIVAEGSKGDWGNYTHIMGEIHLLPSLNKEVQKLFRQEISVDEREAARKTKPGPKTFQIVEQISSEEEKNNCLEKMPYLREMIEGLPQHYSENYSDWIRVLWALGNIRKGMSKEDGKCIRKIAFNFCKRSNRANHKLSDEEHKENISVNWGLLRKGGDVLQIGSIWNWLKDENPQLFYQLQKKMHDGKYSIKGSVFDIKKFHSLPNYTEQKAYMEAHYIVILKQDMIYQISPSVESAYKISQFKSARKNLHAKIPKQKEVDGEIIEVIQKTNFITHWEQDETRREYDDAQIQFGDCPKNIYNLFHGFDGIRIYEDKTIEPDFEKAEWFIEEHLKKIMRPAVVEYLLCWMAHCLFLPEERPDIFVLYYGQEGGGKTHIFKFMEKLMGRTQNLCISENNIGKYCGQFNSRLSNKLLCHCEEVSYKATKDCWDIVKDLITNDWQYIERKYGEAKPEKFYARWSGATNNLVAIPNAETSRRLLWIQTNKAYAVGYWKSERNEEKIKECKEHWNHVHQNYIGSDKSPKCDWDERFIKAFMIRLSDTRYKVINWEGEMPRDPQEKFSVQIKGIFKGLAALKNGAKVVGKYDPVTDYYFITKTHFKNYVKKVHYFGEKTGHSQLEADLEMALEGSLGNIITTEFVEGEDWLTWKYVELRKWLQARDYIIEKTSAPMSDEKSAVLKKLLDLEEEEGDQNFKG